MKITSPVRMTPVSSCCRWCHVAKTTRRSTHQGATELSYPGVYIEEITSDVRPITGVSTSTTAFVGSAQTGPIDEPVPITSFAGFEQHFGGLWIASTLGFAVRDFFLNGGSNAIVVRVN